MIFIVRNTWYLKTMIKINNPLHQNMISQIVDGLSKILGPIATLSKERRELKDAALRGICNALDETYLYYRDLDKGTPRSLDREGVIAKYWSAAAISMRHFDPHLAELCDLKSEFWIQPDQYKPEDIKNIGIGLNDVRTAYRQHLRPGITKKANE